MGFGLVDLEVCSCFVDRCSFAPLMACLAKHAGGD
jgi:hypothetical protein